MRVGCVVQSALLVHCAETVGQSVATPPCSGLSRSPVPKQAGAGETHKLFGFENSRPQLFVKVPGGSGDGGFLHTPAGRLHFSEALVQVSRKARRGRLAGPPESRAVHVAHGW